MDQYRNFITPISLLVVIRKAPKLVKPAAQTPSRVIPIPIARIPIENFGFGYGNILASHLVFFESNSSIPKQQESDTVNQLTILRRLESSLQQVLVTYYPFAGRLFPHSGHEHRELRCNTEGVVYVEAQANVTLLELRKLDKLYWSDLECDFRSQLQTEIPPLVIQVTSLTCGGFVVSIKVLHALCDSQGILHFLHAWSEVTRYESLNNAPTLVKPIWDGIIPIHESEHLPQRIHFPSFDMHIEESSLQPREPHKDMVQNPLVERLSNISIPIQNLIKLQNTINITCNKFEALAALFLREHVRALSLPPSSEVTLFFPAPVHHDVHLAFYGQYAFNCKVMKSANDLKESDLTSIVRSLQDAKNLLDTNSFHNCVKEFGSFHSTSRRVSPPRHVLIFTLLWDGISHINFGNMKFGNHFALHAPDVVRLHSPVNVIAVTGGLEHTIELAMTNVHPSLKANVHRVLQEGHFPSNNLNSSKL